MEGTLVKVLLLVGSLLILCCTSHAFIVSVDAHNEECFFENVEGGTKFGMWRYGYVVLCGLFH